MSLALRNIVANITLPDTRYVVWLPEDPH